MSESEVRSGIEFDKKDASIVGISMLNSHFTPENIALAAADARRNAHAIYFMLPDVPAQHTLAGYGYLPEEARKTSERKFKALAKHCRFAIESVLLGSGHIVRWGDFCERQEYRDMLQRMNDLYAANPDFGACVRSVTASVYQGSPYPMKRDMLPEEQVEAGRHFLLQELAFILASPQILNVATTEYVYHRDMPVLESLVAGAYSPFPATSTVSFRKIDTTASV